MLRSTWILLGLLGFIGGCDTGTVVVPDAPSGSQDAAEEMLSNDAEVIKFTPIELTNRLKTDTGELAKETKGKWIEVSGRVVFFDYVTIYKRAMIGIKAGDGSTFEEEIYPYAVCGMISPEEAWGKVSPGEEITVRMKWNDEKGMHAGRIISPVSGQLVKSTTAKELMQAIADDREAAIKKYHGKNWIVSGIVSKHQTELAETTSFSNDVISLVGDSNVSIATHLVVPQFLALFEPGKEVVVLGEIQISDPMEITAAEPFAVRINNASRLDGNE